MMKIIGFHTPSVAHVFLDVNLMTWFLRNKWEKSKGDENRYLTGGSFKEIVLPYGARYSETLIY
jgi:hypothetical protein